MTMEEFMIMRGDPLEIKMRRRRAIWWGTVVSIVFIIVVLFVLRALGRVGEDVAWVVGILTLTVLYLSLFLAIRDLAHYGERDMVFLLTEDAIERKWKGQPDLKFKFSDIDSVREELSWLILRRNKPPEKIAIPKAIRGYEFLRAELEKHCPFSSSVDFPLKSMALLVISILSWAAVLCFSGLRVVIPSGVIALLSLAAGSKGVSRLVSPGLNRVFMWLGFGFIWFLAILLIYLRVMRAW